MKSAGKARNNGLYRHIRTSKEIIRNLLNDYMQKFRYREHNKKVVVLIDKKKKILEQLETFSINRASLFPEIECVSEYLKNKYL